MAKIIELFEEIKKLHELTRKSQSAAWSAERKTKYEKYLEALVRELNVELNEKQDQRVKYKENLERAN